MAMMRLSRLALSVACLAPLALGAQSSSMTVDALLSDPFPTQLRSSPTGKAVAWVADSAGSRNVWVAESPGWTGRKLTPYTGDDGQEITGLEWLADGSGVVYARGGDPNRAGELPNPTFVPAGVQQDVWVATLQGGALRKLGAGSEPAPGGGLIAFVRKDQIWTAGPLTTDTATQLLHTRGKIGTLRWSPDGTRLAFESARGDHAFIGVYDTRAKTLRYLAPGLDVDQDPIWSPDGRSVAFVRRPAVTRTEIFGPKRTGRPWSIWVADATSGTGRAIWTADEGVGSVFHRLDANDQLFWTAGGVIVFPWERDGWEHLYAVATAGGEPRVLTPGQFEVEQAILTPDRSQVLLTSNQDDSPRRHVWRLNPEKGAPVAVTHGDGIEWSPVSAGGAIALLRSGARTPARPAIVTAQVTPRDLVAIPANFPAERELVTPTEVTFPAADGLLLHGQLFLPSDLAAGQRRPAIVFFHGGSRRQMLLGFHYMDFYHNCYSINQYLASRGYIVLSVNYRSGIGYGLDFREALDYGATGASEYNDVQGAGLYLRGRSDVDGHHIGVWGGSYGGYLTAMALARSSDLFAAGVDYAGVHDWNLEFDALVPGWDVAKDQRARAIAFASSPMADVDHWHSPVLLVQGDDDRNVVFSQTVQLAEDLRGRHVHVETIVFPDETHDLLLYGSWVALGRATAEFFDRQLREEKKLSAQ
jgi:dipeptidyl aminopeptidase/acylaminoacyl peptidase